MSILCAQVPSFSVAVAQREHGTASDRPLLIVDKLEHGRVVACDASASALGAQVGMTLLQATSRAYDAEVLVDHPARNHEVWQHILDSLDMVSPLVEDAQPGTAFLGMRGMPGTPRQWLARARDVLQASGIAFTFACAQTKSVAQIMARVHDGAIVPPHREAEALAPLPLAVLDMPMKMYERFIALGLATLGELAALPYGPFVRRFGKEAAILHERARGIDTRLLAPRPQALRIERALFGEGSASSQEQLLFALRNLLGDFVGDLANAGLRCGRIICLLECEDGESRELRIPLARPTAQSEIFFDLLKARLEAVTLDAAVTGIRLSAEALEEGGGAIALFRNNEPDLDRLATTVARLSAFLEHGAVKQVRQRAAHRVDEAFIDMPVVAQPHSASYTATSAADQSARLTYRIIAPRVLQVECGHGKPLRVDQRRVVDAAGPWRYEQRWWAERIPGDAPYRNDDQFDVLLETGALWRIAHSNGTWMLCGIYD